MAKKKDNNKLIIIIAIAVILLIAQPGGIGNTTQNVSKVVDVVKEKVYSGGGGGGTPSAQTNPNLGDPEKDFMSIRLYDENGNLIQVPQTFSVVNGIPGVYSLDYTVALNNSGTRDLSCTLTSVTPATPFDCPTCSLTGGASITKSTISVKGGNRIAWTSNRISTSSMEGLSQPISIIATVNCIYYEGQTPSAPITKTGQISITVTPISGSADFNVQVNAGGVPTEYCGDGTCQSPLENSQNCVRDCVIIPNTAFRTGDLSYTSGSAIAWNGGTCSSSALTRYGYTSLGCQAVTDATCPTISGANLRISSGIKGNPSWSTTSGCLYQKTSPTTQMILAFKQSGTTGPCSGAGQWGLINYDSADPDANGVTDQAASWDSSKELTC